MPAGAQVTDIASSPPDPFVLGSQPNFSNEHYGAQAFSDDARYVVFDSQADNLVGGDDNHNYDTFLRDRVAGTLTLVSHRPDGRPGSGQSYESAVSGNGRFVAFESAAEDLVAGDTNGLPDVFVFDRTTGLVERVSVSSLGQQGDETSEGAGLSRDGRYVLFSSEATNLVPDDTNDAEDVFVRDRQLGLTFRVSVGAGGVQGNREAREGDIDATGRFICFVSHATNLLPADTDVDGDIYRYDLTQGTTVLVSRTPGGVSGNDSARHCSIAADSGVIAFASSASDLVPGDANASSDVFVHDPSTGTTTRIEAGQTNRTGALEPDLSADGRYVAFRSDSDALPGPHRGEQGEVYLHDRNAGLTTRVSLATGGAAPLAGSDAPRIAPDGSAVLYGAFSDDQVTGDTNRQRDAVIFDVASGTRARAAVPPVVLPSGAGGSQPSISGDGRYIAFTSESMLLGPQANGLAQVWLYDSVTRALTLISRSTMAGAGNGRSVEPRMSADGRFIAYVSAARDLVSAPDIHFRNNVYVYDRMNDTTARVTTAMDGNGANHDCDRLEMSADGNRLAFVTQASNLVPGAMSFAVRLVVFDRGAGTFVRADVGAAGELPNAFVVERAGLSANGRYVAYSSRASNVVNDPNPFADAFRKDLLTGELLLVSRRSDGGAANDQAHEVAISGDGRYVAYRALATNLVAGDDNEAPDIFRTDAVTGTTIRITDRLRGPSSAGSQRPQLSHDGRQVAFESQAAFVADDTNERIDVYVADVATGALRRASVGPNGEQCRSQSTAIAWSADREWLTFAMSPSDARVPGRYNAPAGPDAVKARNPVAAFLFSDGYE